jgi:hypothetical protein
MTKHQKWLMVGLVVGTTLSVAAIGSSAIIDGAANGDPGATDSLRIVDDRKLPEQWAINAAYGRGALSNLRAALIEVTNDNPQEARKGVAVAQSLLTQITLESPVEEAISQSGIQAETDFVLVHSEVRVLGDADPVQATLDSIRHEFEVTDHDAIVTALRLLNVPLAYTRIDLPLSDTIALVDDILHALDSQDSEQARSKLMEIGDRLRIETVQIGTENSPVDALEANDAG